MHVPRGLGKFTFPKQRRNSSTSVNSERPSVSTEQINHESAASPHMAPSSRTQTPAHATLLSTGKSQADVQVFVGSIEIDDMSDVGSDSSNDDDEPPVKITSIRSHEIPALSEPPSPPQDPQGVSVIPSASSLDLLILEVSVNDIDYDSDASVTFPWQCEDVQTDNGKADNKDPAQYSDDNTYDWSSSSSSSPSLVGNMEQLRLRQCEREFEAAQHRKYLRKKKKWRKGGNHKRSHVESLGSESDDNEDIVPLDDADVMGASARRLRRRTDTTEARPSRTSLLFDDPPREIEELLQQEIVEGTVIDTDDELMLPLWMYPNMAMDSDGSDDDDDGEEAIPVIRLPPLRSRHR